MAFQQQHASADLAPDAATGETDASHDDLQSTVGNAGVAEMLALPAVDDPWAAPRTDDERADLALDCLGAIVSVETGGNVRQSRMHTVAGVSASYASASQHIASKTVSVLDRFDDEQLAALDLTRDDIVDATRVCGAVRTVWGAAVDDRSATTVEDLKDVAGDRAIRLSRLTDADLERMLRGGELFAELRAQIAAAGGRPRLLDDDDARREVAEAFAETDIARAFDIRATDANAYIRKGFAEDMAAWMRVALSRPPAGGEDDQLGARIQEAAEGEGGWRMPRVDVEGAVRRHLDAEPISSDLDALRAAIAHHSQSGGGGEYFERAERSFRDLRRRREAGEGWLPPGTEAPGTEAPGTEAPASSDPVTEAMAGGLPLLLAVARMLSKLTLDGSVGRGGDNGGDDVRAVVLRLQLLGHLDDDVTTATLGDAVQRFQVDVVGMQKGDGRIDPGGKTLEALNGAVTGLAPPKPEAPTEAPDIDVPQVDPPETPADGPAPAPAPASGLLPLSAAVGDDAPNAAGDVAAVRARLLELGYAPGSSDADLVDAIAAFQRCAFNAKGGDGRIDVGGQTHHALSSGAAQAPTGRDPAALVDELEHPDVVMLRFMIDQLEQAEGQIAESDREEVGAARDRFVERLGAARTFVDTMVLLGLGAEDAQAVRAWGHRRLNALSPYYSQGRSVNFLETADSTRICNLTALAMALEALGRSAGSYTGDLATLEQIRAHEGKGGHYDYDAVFDKAKETVGEGLSGLRLPDFLQLATVARRMEEGSDLLGAVKQAWDDILFPDRLRAIAVRFGVNAWVINGLGGSGRLRDRYQATYGAELDRGHQVVLLTPGHYVRLQSVTEDGLVVDDPGRTSKKDKAIPWSEASGYALKGLIVA
jgi:hypothetical protein